MCLVSGVWLILNVDPMQALLDAIASGNSVASASAERLERVYETVMACIGVTMFVTLMFLLLASAGMLLSPADMVQQPLVVCFLLQQCIFISVVFKCVHLWICCRRNKEQPQADAWLPGASASELSPAMVHWSSAVRSTPPRR